MCGIAGLIDPRGGLIDRELLGRMTSALARRGPDGQHSWVAPGVGLGHSRLKVMDPSDAARQPLGSEDGQVQVVFNGEIYNFADLRAELRGHGHRFASRSDTEVLVHGYEQWGDGVLDRVHGMFAFAIWDARQRRLLAARDRLGKKPLYFAEVASVAGGEAPLFAFASELKALLCVPGFSRALDPQALGAYLVFDYVPPPATIFTQARKLAAGEKLVLELGPLPHEAEPALRRSSISPVVSTYWDLPFPAQHGDWSEEQAVGDLRTLLERSVERRLVADVPLGLFLSGGLDSSAVAAVAAGIAGADRLQTFSVGFDDPSFDESAQARLVAAHLGTDHHEERLGPAALLDALPAIGDFCDEPLADASLVPTFLLCRFARREVTVALGGDGSDELFAGYPTFQADLAGRLFFGVTPAPMRRLARRLTEELPAGDGYLSLGFKLRQFLRGGGTPGPVRHQRWLSSFLPEELPTLLAGDLAKAAGDPLAAVAGRAARGPAVHQADRLLDFYARFYLPDQLNTKVDRAAGAVGLEVRAPFLDTDLVSFACQLPPRLRQRRLTGKYLLKRAMRGRLPDAIIDRPKHGFAAPVARWLRQELRPALLDELSPGRIARQGLFQPAAVARLLEDHLSGRRDRRKALWSLFTFQRWYGHWGSSAS